MSMSMQLLYNIEKFNNTVTMQSSVSMYTDVYSIPYTGNLQYRLAVLPNMGEAKVT